MRARRTARIQAILVIQTASKVLFLMFIISPYISLFATSSLKIL